MIAALLALFSQAAQEPVAPAPDPERLFRRCIACHALEPGRNSPAGPTLHAIVGRRVAAEAGFRYSPALQAWSRLNPVWTPERLDRFLADPMTLVPGTDMTFNGLDDRDARAALIRWLARPTAETG